jgi:hypothetical protein
MIGEWNRYHALRAVRGQARYLTLRGMSRSTRRNRNRPQTLASPSLANGCTIATMHAADAGDPALALTLASALLPVLACIAAGSLVGRGSLRWPGADMLVGFGLLASALAILAIITPVPLSWLAAGLVVAAAAGCALRWQAPGGRSTWIALALILPVLIVAAGHSPAMWDDFWNWLPSAAYAYWHNSLPWPDQAPSLSIFPAYPQGMPLMIASASFLAGRFLEGAGPAINALLLAGGSAVLAEALAAALVRRGRLQATEMPVALVAAAVAITTLLNPGLDGGVLLSSYADCATMVAVGALGLLGVELLVRLSTSGSAHVEGLAWRFGFVAALLLNLKQINPALLALLVIGLVLVACREPALRTRRALSQLPRMLGPGVVFLLFWRWYVKHGAPNAEQSFRPLYDWNFGELEQMLAAIGGLLAEAPLFHGMMWLVTVAGVVFFFQLPRKSSEARWLAIICAIVWPGYNAVLLISYLGVMTPYDAQIAADYWRYSPHVALLGLYAPVLGLTCARWPAWLKLRSSAATLAAILLALGALPARSDLNNPPNRAWLHFVRGAALEMRQIIPAAGSVLIVPYWNSSPFGVALRYGLWALDTPAEHIDARIVWDSENFAKVASWAARGEAEYLIVQDGEGAMDDRTDALGLPRLHHELALFRWQDGAWRKVKSWPIPPELLRRE